MFWSYSQYPEGLEIFVDDCWKIIFFLSILFAFYFIDALKPLKWYSLFMIILLN